MKIDRKYEIEQATSNDETRIILSQIQINQDCAVATDGRMLALVPIEVSDSDIIGNIDNEFIKEVRRKTKKRDSVELLLEKDFITSSDTKKQRLDFGTLPDWKPLMNGELKEIQYQISLDPELLLCLARALGSKNSITLKFTGKDETIRVTPTNEDNKAKGLLMPIRCKS